MKAVLREQLERLYDVGFRRFLIGCEIGVDLWAGEIVIDLMKDRADMELICVIPFEQQPIYWSVRNGERYYTMLASCTKAIMIHPRYTPNCFTKRNDYMVKHANVLLAVHDMNSKRRSITGMAIAYARKKRIPVITVHPSTFAVSPDLNLIRT